jgi:acetylornithine/succinyldiaminopimelate/putrescine aminotransferase
MAIHHSKVKADILILGKSLSGGVLPVSAVLADDEVNTFLNFHIILLEIFANFLGHDEYFPR